MKPLARQATGRLGGVSVPRENVGFLPLILIVATLVAYWPAREHGFVRWDEQLYVTENPFLTEPNGLWKSWTTIHETERQYYPLLLTSYWFQYRLWGNNPAGYHAVNVWFHICNSVLVLFLLAALGASRWVAGVSALLFALHPIQVESVAWIAELKNLQSGFFYLIAFLFYQYHRSAVPPVADHGRLVKGWAAYGGAFFFYLCALFSKTASMTLPLSLFLADWLLVSGGNRRWWRGSLMRVAPMLVMAIVPGLITISLEEGPAPEVIPAMALRPLIASAALWFYVGKLVMPIHLVPIYPRWEVAADLPWFWMAAIGLGVAMAALWYWRRRLSRLALWGLGHFVASLLPLLGFIPFGYLDYSFVADHFVYLASIGFFLIVAVVIEWVVVKGLSQKTARWWIATGLVCALLAGLAGLTRKQIVVWRDALTFWSYVAAENPDSADVQNNLGNAYLRQNRLEDAAVHYRQALQIKPNSSLAHMNLGLVLSEQGRVKKAIEEYQLAIDYQPSNWRAHYKLAVAFAQLGQFQDAVREADQAIALATARGQSDAVDEMKAWINRYRSTQSK